MLAQNLEKLISFVGVVSAGSIRKYSILSNLSQPAVSKSIQNLETAVEATLLVRHRDGVTLTQAGKVLFDWAAAVLSESEQIALAVRSGGNTKIRAQLKMGTYLSISVYFVPKLFKFILQTQNGITLQLISASSGELVTLLKAGSVDFIISIDPPRSAEFHQVSLFEDFYSLYRKVGNAQNSNKVLIFTLDSALDRKRRSIKSYAKQAGLQSQIVGCTDFEVAKAMLESDVGWAILPDRVAWSMLRARSIERVTGFETLHGFGAHAVVFSCRAHRAADQALTWISSQLALMLTEST